MAPLVGHAGAGEVNDSRGDILVKELAKTLDWTQGSPVRVTLLLGGSAYERRDLIIGFALAAQLLGRMRGTVVALGLVAPVPMPADLGSLVQNRGSVDVSCATMLNAVGIVPATVGRLAGSLTIHVGHEPGGTQPNLAFDADEWLAYVNRTGTGRASSNPLGAIGAACLVANELFQSVHVPGRSPERIQFSMWDSSVGGAQGPALPKTLPDFNLAGAGAVTHGFLWSAVAAGIVTSGLCADPDIVDVTNLERLILATTANLDEKKVAVISSRLEGSCVMLEPRDGRLEDVAPDDRRALLVAIDDDTARPVMAQFGSPLTIQATTGGLALTIERSTLDLSYACVACGHPIVGGPSLEELGSRLGIDPNEFNTMLSTERIREIEVAHGLALGTLNSSIGRDTCGQLGPMAAAALGIGGPSGSVGFLSCLAGALLLAEYVAVQRGDGRSRRTVVNLINPRRVSRRDPRPRANCGCQDKAFQDFMAKRRMQLGL